MNPFKRHAAEHIDRDVKVDLSAYFIHAFALGMPKSLATVKAASDRFDGSTRLVSPLPSLEPMMDCLMPRMTWSHHMT